SGAAAPRAASAPGPVTSIPPMTQTSVGERLAPRGLLHVTPASHVIGVGGLVASTSSFGATARAWHDTHLGAQFGFTPHSMTGDAALGRVTSVQIEPGVVFALFDSVSDYLWIRPYVGSAASFRHQTLNVAAPVALAPQSDTGIGFRVFGGGELTFAGMPRFG